MVGDTKGECAIVRGTSPERAFGYSALLHVLLPAAPTSSGRGAATDPCISFT